MDAPQIKQVVLELVGPLDPVGSSHVDRVRESSLIVLQEVVEGLLLRMEDLVRLYEDRPEYSVRIIGKKARRFLVSTRNELGEW